MKITVENYELFAIDYLEGNLSEDANKQFQEFLSENPDIFDSLATFGSFKLEPSKEKIFDTGYLKKKSPLNNSELEYLCIGFLENTLNSNEKNRFEEALCLFPEVQRELNMYRETKLSADLAIIFPYKKNLKKGVFFWSNPFIYKATLAAAAVVLLYFSVNVSQNINEINLPENHALAVNDSMLIPRTDSNHVKIQLPYSQDEIDRIKTGAKKSKSVSKSNQMALNSQVEVQNESIRDMELISQVNPILAKGNLKVKPENLVLNGVNSVYEDLAYEKPKDYLTIKEWMVKTVKQKLFNVEPEKDITFWVVAESGVNAINQFTNIPIQMNNRYNEDGKLSYLAVGTEKVKFEREIKRNNPK